MNERLFNQMLDDINAFIDKQDIKLIQNIDEAVIQFFTNTWFSPKDGKYCDCLDNAWESAFQQHLFEQIEGFFNKSKVLAMCCKYVVEHGDRLSRFICLIMNSGYYVFLKELFVESITSAGLFGFLTDEQKWDKQQFSQKLVGKDLLDQDKKDSNDFYNCGLEIFEHICKMTSTVKAQSKFSRDLQKQKVICDNQQDLELYTSEKNCKQIEMYFEVLVENKQHKQIRHVFVEKMLFSKILNIALKNYPILSLCCLDICIKYLAYIEKYELTESKNKVMCGLESLSEKLFKNQLKYFSNEAQARRLRVYSDGQQKTSLSNFCLKIIEFCLQFLKLTDHTQKYLEIFHKSGLFDTIQVIFFIIKKPEFGFYLERPRHSMEHVEIINNILF